MFINIFYISEEFQLCYYDSQFSVHTNKANILDFTLASCCSLAIIEMEGQNRLDELPESFGNLRSLRYCQLSKNKIELLPSSFGDLSNLEELRLDNNIVGYFFTCIVLYSRHFAGMSRQLCFNLLILIA